MFIVDPVARIRRAADNTETVLAQLSLFYLLVAIFGAIGTAQVPLSSWTIGLSTLVAMGAIGVGYGPTVGSLMLATSAVLVWVGSEPYRAEFTHYFVLVMATIATIIAWLVTSISGSFGRVAEFFMWSIPAATVILTAATWPSSTGQSQSLMLGCGAFITLFGSLAMVSRDQPHRGSSCCFVGLFASAVAVISAAAAVRSGAAMCGILMAALGGTYSLLTLVLQRDAQANLPMELCVAEPNTIEYRLLVMGFNRERGMMSDEELRAGIDRLLYRDDAANSNDAPLAESGAAPAAEISQATPVDDATASLGGDSTSE